MAARKKTKAGRRSQPKKAKAASKRGKAARKSSAKRAVRKTGTNKSPARKRTKRPVAKTRPATKSATPAETLIVDTVEEPVPGVVVVTETEYKAR